MKQIEITTSVTIFENVEELPNDVKELMNKAVEARKNAYAPYSDFEVGAALLLENGEVITGNNQENAAYPSGMCAERVAVWKASSEFPNQKILKIVLTATSRKTKNTTPVAPCGGCRQTLLEYEQKQDAPMEVYFMGAEGEIYKTNSLTDLVPIAFGKSFL
ncbi:cytidine deaminase [Aureivirga marina]|uniref:cytidine deaminase n=1 Tax=Aureivirga marina TaxID=1182451 RepID=UPI0018CA06B9|nr:cytidine deaminase [Aureivirga marina]